MRKYCEECSHQHSEFCYGCAYSDKYGMPNLPDRDKDDD